MRTDREALIAGIAADTGNDLRKLVFADWLEEHGEPERAEFIRLVVERGGPTSDSFARKKRTQALFANHWQKWFGPFFEVLNPGRGLEGVEPSAEWLTFQSTNGPQPWSACRHLATTDGFISRVDPDLNAFPPGASLDRAMRQEPVSSLLITLATNSRWREVTGSALDQLRHLAISFGGYNRDQTLHEFELIMGDPHLTSVAHLVLSINGPIGEIPPQAFTAPFAASRLASTVRHLRLSGHDADGLQPVCAVDQLRLEELSFNGPLTRRCGELLSSARFADTVEKLEIEAELRSRGRISAVVSALAEGRRWKALKELDVRDRVRPGVSVVGLKALAKAPFVPQLEVLKLTFDDNPDPKLVTEIVERLDPSRVRQLFFERCGEVPMPECFVRRFGERAQAESANERDPSYWCVTFQQLPNS